MDQNYLFITNVAEVVAFLLAVINFKKIKNTTEVGFVFFLAYTIITELIGIYYGHVIEEYNLTVYIIFVVVSFLFYLIWFHSILKSKMLKQVMKILILGFLILSVYNLITLEWQKYHVSTFVFGAISTIIASVLFYSQLLSNKNIIDVQHNIKFWITTGLLLFNVGMVPLIIFSEEFGANNGVRVMIMITFNLILYGCYSLGFILNKKPMVS